MTNFVIDKKLHVIGILAFKAENFQFSENFEIILYILQVATIVSRNRWFNHKKKHVNSVHGHRAR